MRLALILLLATNIVVLERVGSRYRHPSAVLPAYFGEGEGGSGTGLVERREKFVADGISQSFLLAEDPVAPVKVFRNGVLMADPEDYEVIGSSVVFNDPTEAGDLIQVLYWRMNG